MLKVFEYVGVTVWDAGARQAPKKPYQDFRDSPSAIGPVQINNQKISEILAV